MDRETFIELIPAYTLGALDADEHKAFEIRLASDPEAQQLVAEYQEIADLLVLTAPARVAPAHLNNDLKRRLAEQRKVVPLTPVHHRTSVLPRLVALAAVLVVLVGIVWLLASQSQPVNTARQLFETLSAQENAIRVALVPQEGQEQVTGELVALLDSTQAVIRMDSLPLLAAEQTFQLWLADADGLQPSDLFQSTAEDATYLVIPLEEPVNAYQAFAVSIEPGGGSPDPGQPTGPVVFTVPVVTT